MGAETMARLDQRARSLRESKARTAERLIDEGLRMDAHPGIVFKDGPTGRRAAVAIGPDVWEIIGTIQSSGLKGEKAITAAAEWGNLSPAQVRTAVSYYAEFKDEIDGRIALNLQEADRLYALWLREQEALG
jgi:hypothetical protein